MLLNDWSPSANLFFLSQSVGFSSETKTKWLFLCPWFSILPVLSVYSDVQGQETRNKQQPRSVLSASYQHQQWQNTPSHLLLNNSWSNQLTDLLTELNDFTSDSSGVLKKNPGVHLLPQNISVWNCTQYIYIPFYGSEADQRPETRDQKPELKSLENTHSLFIHS